MDSDFQLAWHIGDDYPEWGSAPRRPLVQFDMAHKGEWMASVIGRHPRTGADMIYHVVRCELCIATHLYPLSSPDDLTAYYTQSFYQKTKPNYVREYEEDSQWWRIVHRTILDAAAPWLPSAHVVMLDVGAGPGCALAIGEARGYATVALEPSPVAARWLREQGHDVLEMTLAQLLASGHSLGFSLLYVYEVLEHQSNPEEFLLQCYDALAPGGVLIVAVPNDFTPAQFEACRRFNLPLWFVAPPDHQWYATPITLKLMARRCGFSLKYMRMSYPMIEEFILKQGLCYVGNATLGRQCHSERMGFELATFFEGRWPILEAQYIANVERRIGREIIGIFQKI